MARPTNGSHWNLTTEPFFGVGGGEIFEHFAIIIPINSDHRQEIKPKFKPNHPEEPQDFSQERIPLIPDDLEEVWLNSSNAIIGQIRTFFGGEIKHISTSLFPWHLHESTEEKLPFSTAQESHLELPARLTQDVKEKNLTAQYQAAITSKWRILKKNLENQ